MRRQTHSTPFAHSKEFVGQSNPFSVARVSLALPLSLNSSRPLEPYFLSPEGSNPPYSLRFARSHPSADTHTPLTGSTAMNTIPEENVGNFSQSSWSARKLVSFEAESAALGNHLQSYSRQTIIDVLKAVFGASTCGFRYGWSPSVLPTFLGSAREYPEPCCCEVALSCPPRIFYPCNRCVESCRLV